MFHLNRGKKITGQCRFPGAPFDILMSGQQGYGGCLGFVEDRHQRVRLMPVEGTLREHYVLSS